MTLFFVFIISVFLTMVLIPPLMRSAAQWQVIDLPDERKVHTGAIPRIGGVAMVMAAMLPMILFLPPQKEVIGFLVGAVVILFFGVWDDRKNLNYKIKFLGQIIAVLVVVVYGGVTIKYVPFLGLAPLPEYLSIPLTIFALLGITNAINLADGLDGLAGGTTMLSLGMIAILAYMADGANLVLIAVPVMGAILGFLRYNTYPATIFMGDGGSQFLGFSLGVVVTLLTQEVNTALSPAVAVMILGLPILDTLMVMGQRIYEGRSPFAPDKNHIHHKLLALGFDHYEAVFLIYLVQSILVVGAYLMRFQSDLLVVFTYLAFCVAVIVFFRAAALAGWHTHAQQNVGRRSLFSRLAKRLRENNRMLKLVLYFAIAAIAAYLLLVALFAQSVSPDIGALSAVLLVAMLGFCFTRNGQSFNIAERGIAYVTAAVAVFLALTVPGPLVDVALYRDVFFVLLAVAVGIGFRFSQANRFRMSPMDFLVIFVAIAVPNLPGEPFLQSSIGEGIAKLIVLFYGIELVLTNIERRSDIMRMAVCSTLVVLCARGMLL